jgi:hypothetical protein
VVVHASGEARDDITRGCATTITTYSLCQGPACRGPEGEDGGLFDVGIGSYETKTSLGQLCFRLCDEHFMSDSAVLARLAAYNV